MTSRTKILLATVCAIMLAACAAPQPVAVSDLSNLPAEQALMAGIRLYEDGQYTPAEPELKRSLALKLHAAKDTANAYKYLAFIYCTSERVALCQQSFRDAFAADPSFALTKAEQGHPVWGPIYRRVVEAR